jgi:hypothetical protein
MTQVIVFILGGATYEEAKAVAAMNEQAQVRVLSAWLLKGTAGRAEDAP